MARSRFSVLATVTLALVSGIIGGAAAQGRREQPNPQVVPDVVRAKHFELIDDIGNKRATIGIDRDGTTQIVLYDAKGIVTWAAGRVQVRPASE
jgi:hypothetical protein